MGEAEPRDVVSQLQKSVEVFKPCNLRTHHQWFNLSHVSESLAEIAAHARTERTARVSKQCAELLPTITQIQAEGATTLRAIAAQLNAREIEAPRGGQWAAVQVQRALKLATKQMG